MGVTLTDHALPTTVAKYVSSTTAVALLTMVMVAVWPFPTPSVVPVMTNPAAASLASPWARQS